MYKFLSLTIKTSSANLALLSHFIFLYLPLQTFFFFCNQISLLVALYQSCLHPPRQHHFFHSQAWNALLVTSEPREDTLRGDRRASKRRWGNIKSKFYVSNLFPDLAVIPGMGEGFSPSSSFKKGTEHGG